MRVLIVCSYKPQLPEGVAPFVREQVEAIAKCLRDMPVSGVQCTVYGEHSAVEYYHIKGKGMVGYLREVPKLRKKIREWKPDVVHAHFGLSCLVANLATRRVPVVSMYHGSDINVASVRRFSKIAMRLSAWNIFVSKRNVDIAKPKKRWSLIPCGVNLPLAWDELKKQKVEQLTLNQWVEGVLEPNKRHVLFAGAFDNAVKDPGLAKNAVAMLNDANDGNDANDVQLIELKGYTRNQVNALMYSCDALLMTSKTEGSPQVIKEAMACGCPIVSVDVGDVAERTEGMDGCYIVPIDDRLKMIDELARALEKALAFKGRTNGREKILEAGLTNEQVAKRIIAIYEDIINKLY